jgi:cyclic dehypoxanthinyl futalosine synthase
MSERDIHVLIRDAGYIPAKRDTHYNVLKVFPTPEDVPDLPSRPQRVVETIPLAVR